MDAEMLAHLEGCGSINWNTTPYWQCRRVDGGGVAGEESKWMDAKALAHCLEVWGIPYVQCRDVIVWWSWS